MKHEAVILCVDDEEYNLFLMEEILSSHGYRLFLAKHGEAAITILQRERIDLVLLDVKMPGMDGLEVCRRIKADEATREIPVLFVTSIDDKIVETTGLGLGAADYLIKPINDRVLLARVQTHLALKAHRERLEELAETRARQLFHAERLSTLGTLTAGIVHELCSPLTYVLAFTEALQCDMENLAGGMPPPGADEPEPLDSWRRFLEKDTLYVSKLSEGLKRIHGIVDSMRKYSRYDQADKAPVCLNDCVENAINLCRNTLKNKITLRKERVSGLPPIMVNSQQIEQVFVNLLRNAADAMDKTEQAELCIALGSENGMVRCIVEDNGPGIPPDHLESIWEPFFTTKDAETGTGLGLSISRGIIEKHRGRIWAENRRSGKGARFVVELPANA